MSSFLAKKRDKTAEEAEDRGMVIRATTVKNRQRSIVGRIRVRIEAAGERVWRAADFQGADRAWTAQAIAQALSRLSRQGVVRRFGKGLYYRGRETAFGPSLPMTCPPSTPPPMWVAVTFFLPKAPDGSRRDEA